MKKFTFAFLVSSLFSVTLLAADSVDLPGAVATATAKLSSDSVRTTVTKVSARDANPCADAGSYVISIEVKRAILNPETGKISYQWTVAKSVNVAQDGKTSEVCGE